MKLILVALAFASFAASAKLSSVIETTEVTCAELKSRINRNGWMNLEINGKPQYPHRFTVQALWPNGVQCDSGEYGDYTYVPTSDKARCLAGYVCVESYN